MKIKSTLSKALACLLAAVTVGGSMTVLTPMIAETSITVQAASNVWSGKEDTSWYNSSKKEFYISTPEQLAGLSKLVREGTSFSYEDSNKTRQLKHIYLTNDIVMNDTSNYNNWGTNPPKNNWTAVGANKYGTSPNFGISATYPHKSFDGCFDGNGHTITGLYSKNNVYAGLFSEVSNGIVMRVVMKKSYIEAVRNENVNIAHGVYAGGISAVVTSSAIIECDFDGKVYANDHFTKMPGHTDTSDGACAGGIVGKYERDPGYLTSQILIAALTGIVINPVITLNVYGKTNKVENFNPAIYCCINRGSINASYLNKYNPHQGDNFNGYAAGAGGIVGLAEPYNKSHMTMTQGGVVQCANLGAVSGKTDAVKYYRAESGVTYASGGLIGRTMGLRLLDNYYVNNVNRSYGWAVTGIPGYDNVLEGYEENAKRFTKTADNLRIIAKNLGSMFSFYNNDLRLSCDLVTHNGPVTLSSTQMSLGKGESVRLTATIIDPTVKSLKWRTSNSKILTVDQNGNVKAVGTGTAWITVRTSTGKEKSCKVTVKAAPSSVKLSNGVLTIGVGETRKLSAILPDNTAAAVRTFRSSNNNIVKMTKTNWEGEFKGVKEGIAYVTVRLFNGKEATCKVTVKAAPTWVSVNKKTMTLKVGQTATLSSYIASNAGCATRTFRTSNSSIVKMTKTNWSAQFTALKRGTAWVTVRTYNGRESTCKVTVV